MDPFPRFALYTAIRRLGEGSSSVVLLAKGSLDATSRALKVFNPDDGSSAQFLRELELALQSSHPNIVRLVDFGKTLDTGQDYLAFEYLEGQDFVAASKTASQHQFYSMLAQVCRALDFVHRRGISHGDLKPQNILVTFDRRSQLDAPLVKLLDLGFGRGLDEPSPAWTRGSPHYLAPEVVQGRRPTPGSDLYAFGAILYECLTGAPPFRGGDVGEVLQSHLQSEPPRIQGGALRELHTIVYQLLAKDPGRRPASAADALRLINAASTVGHFRLNTAESWEGHAQSCPLVGRDDLISEAMRALREAARMTTPLIPTILLIRGEKGSGKTRLVRTLSLQARAIGFRVLNLPPPHQDLTLEPLERAVELTLESSLQRPVLVALDDIGSSALDPTLILSTLSLHKRSPNVVVLTSNSSERPAAAPSSILQAPDDGAHFLEWALPPLNEKGIEDAITHMLMISDVDPSTRSLLASQSGGNPLLLGNLIATYLDREVLAVEHGLLRIKAPSPPAAPPSPTIDLAAQIVGELTADERAVAGVLAVARDSWSASVVASLLGMDEDRVWRVVSRLASRGIARCRIQGGSSVYCVAGEAVRAEILRRMPQEERRSVHERVAKFYLGSPEDGSSLERAAAHFVEAGMRQEAILCSSRAARRAEAALEYAGAASSYRFALSQGVEDPMARTELALGLARCALRLGQVSESSELLLALDGDPSLPARQRAKVQILRSRCARFIGDSHDHERFARSALELAIANGMRSEAMEAKWLVGSAMCSHEGPREGLLVLYRTGRAARRDGNRLIAANVMMDASAALWKAGMYKLALNYSYRQYRLLQGSDKPARVAYALQNLATLQSELGMYSQARRSQRQVLASHPRSIMKGEATRIVANIGETFRAQGRWRKALEQYRDALKGARAGGDRKATLVTAANISQVLCTIGHLGEALIPLRHSMIAARNLGSADAILALLWSWAPFLLAVGRYGAAHRLIAHASRLVEAARLWQWMLDLKRCMAVALWNLGKVDEAHGVIVEAIARYEERSPFDVRLSANLTRAQFEQGRGAGLEAMEETLRPLLETARRKKMRWHLATGLLIRAEALLGANLAEQAEAGLQEALDIAYKIADRTLSWQAGYALGRVYEQMLRYERALGCYRMAALTIQELSMNIEEERYRESYLAQPRVREALERYDRLLAEIGKQARRDLAVSNRSEMISRRMLGALSAIGQRLASILDLDELMTGILDLAIENVRAERGIIFLRDEVTGELRPECARGMDREGLKEIATYSRSVIQQVARGQTLLTVDVGKDPGLSAYKSVVLHEIKSILCVPMRARGKIAGVIYLDTRSGPQLFTDKERAFVESFASQAAIAIENARLFGLMKTENARLQLEARNRGRFENLIGTSPAMARLREIIAGVLESDCSVLILGESGTGKELVARALHYNGPRQKRKFVAVDCGALPETLLEAELFGYARGAFTGAARERVGLIEEAHGGTLFLDEITNTTPATQARLLRVLQENEVRRLGENATRRVDVRWVAATNADVKGLLAQGRFRHDLYYRLNIVTIEVPPLRARRDDVALLASRFLGQRAREGASPKRLGPGVNDLLALYDWPGNVRELENAIERLVVLAPGDVITVDDLPDTIRGAARGVTAGAGESGQVSGRKTGEQIMIEEALRRCLGDKAKAARFIGWTGDELEKMLSWPAQEGIRWSQEGWREAA